MDTFLYVFPLIPLSYRTIIKIKQEQADVILINTLVARTDLIYPPADNVGELHKSAASTVRKAEVPPPILFTCLP